jgi:separase
LGTPEATKVLGKDTQELQYESGVLVLIGKLVALGLDNLAVKELRVLKKRLDRYLGQDAGSQEPRTTAAEKETLATLLDFATIDPGSPAVPLVANFQTYTLRIIAKLRRPRLVEAAWEYLKLSSPSSPANLLWHTAKGPNGQAKAARQLESLAQTVLTLCPSISSADDGKELQPSAEAVLLLQHLAFKIRKKWWSLAKHQGNNGQELLEPFSRCLVAYARRSQVAPSKQYKLAESLYKDLIGEQGDSVPSTSATAACAAITKTLSSLAQAAGLSDEALRWLGPLDSSSLSSASAAKQTARAIRIATLSLDAYLKGDEKSDLELSIVKAIEALNGSLGGSISDLEYLFAEVNALRRAATRLLVTRLSSPKDISDTSSIESHTIPIIAATLHFSTRFVGPALPTESDSETQNRHCERIAIAWKCVKSLVDSVMACCKQATTTQDEWTALDNLLQECAHVLRRFEEEIEGGTLPLAENTVLVHAYIVKLSNAYWSVYLQLRRSQFDAKYLVTTMQRSINLVQSGTARQQEDGLLTMKLEQLGEILESLNRTESSRDAYRQCVKSHLGADTSQELSELAATSSLYTVFSNDGPFSILARVLKTYHHSFVKWGIHQQDEVAYYDDCELHPGARGALLELQLGLYLRTLTRNRPWDSNLNQSISALVEQLKELYTPENHPVRHLRLSAMLLQLSNNHPHILSQDLLPPSTSHSDSLQISGTEDEALEKYALHLKALHSLKSSMQQTSPPVGILRQCFTEWEAIVRSASSWDALAGRIDNIEIWLQDLYASLEFLNAKGEEYLALPLLHLLVSIHELQKNLDSTELVNTLCTMGLQFLHLGYTGKAGLSLAKAETCIERRSPSIEARLRWHMAYAEYLLGIGNMVKS